MSDEIAAIQSRHYPMFGPSLEANICGHDSEPWPCDARQEGDRADALRTWQIHAEATIGSLRDQLDATVLGASAAERERDALRAAALEVLRATWRTDENIGALQELDQVLAASPDTGPETQEGRYIERMRSLNHDGCNHADDQWNCR